MKNNWLTVSSKWIYIATLLLLAILASILYDKSKGVPADVHHKINISNSELLKLNVLLKETILEIHFGLQLNYDELVDVSKKISSVQHAYFDDLNKEFQQVAAESLHQLALEISSRQDNIELFKSHSAVLNNSWRYIPVITDEFKYKVGQEAYSRHDNPLVIQVNVLIQAIVDNKDKSRLDVDSELNALIALQPMVPVQLKSLFNDLIKHIQLLVEKHNEVDTLLHEILKDDVATAIGSLIDSYNEYYEAKEYIAGTYQLRWVVLTVIMSLFVVVMLYRLAKTTARLDATVARLNFQQYAIDQHAIISIADVQGNITYVNDLFCQLSEYSEEELLGQNHRIVKSNQHDIPFFKEMWRTISAGDVWHGEVKNKSKSGKSYWVNSTVVPFIGDDGKPFQYISIRTDITKRKQTEKILENERQFHTGITEAMADGVYSQDADGNCTYINPEGERILGWSSEEIIGSHMHEMTHYQHEDGRPIPVHECPIFNSLNSMGAFHTDEEIFWRRDGSAVPVNISAVPIYDGDEFKGAVVAFQDITLRKQQEEERAAAVTFAEQASESKSMFLANMSHEIRTPMNAIIGMSYLALQTDLDSKQRGYIEKVNNSADSLLSLLNDILDFSKIEAQKLELEKAPFSIDDVLRDVSDVLIIPAGKKNLELLLDVDKNIPSILIGDALRLRQSLLNFANNAIKFTHHGEVVISVELKESTSNKVTLEFAVRDSGIGMTAKQKEGLFKVFSQADVSTTRKYGGTGLGLAITAQLIELMEGTIQVESVVDKGSRFSFVISVDVGEERRSRSRDESRISVGASGRILVVDDNESSRDIIEKQLSAQGVEVTTVNSGQSALIKMRNTSFDAIIMDWKMPEMDGVETLIKIDSLEMTHPPVVVMATAFDKSDLEEELAKQEVTVDAVLTKPFSTLTLRDALQKMLEPNGKAKKKDKNLKAEKLEMPLQGQHILLVEDNDVNQHLALSLLIMHGMTADLAENGQQALEHLEIRHYDCVLMDCQMPVMDGYTATKLIRKKYKDTFPVIAMTANVMKDDIDRAKESGMDDVIAKPINVATMIKTMSKWILGQGEEQEEDSQDLLVGNEGLIQKHINHNEGLKLLAGDQALYNQILSRFKVSFSGADEKLSAMLDSYELDDAMRLAHSIKGTAANIGTVSLHKVAGKIEGHCQRNQLALAQVYLDDFNTSLTGVLKEIDAFLLFENKNEGSKRVVNNEVSMQKITLLVQKLRRDLENYDSASELSFENLLSSIAIDMDMDKQALSDIDSAIKSYDFEQALVELNRLYQEGDK